jgi:ubiquinone/menaquinone biosynthesis C-methylase UbiE
MELKQADYVLGHATEEQHRLIRQARVLAPATERFLRDAGISSGMRVLDIGCGMGDVTMLVAQLIGPSGNVISIDLDKASINAARGRASSFGLDNVTFHRADLKTYSDPEPFDAIVGRLVLEFVPNTSGIIKHLHRMLRPGGVMALQEVSWKLWLSYTAHLPLRLAATTLAQDALVASGANTEMEQPLYRGFLDAGLSSPQLRVDVPVGDSPEFRALLPDLLLTLMPRIRTLKLPFDHLGDLQTLASRLDDELNANKSFAAYAALVGTFDRKR